MQRHLDLGGLVLLQDDALLHQQPVVGGDGDADQQQTARPEDRREQRQSPRAERTHLRRDRKKKAYLSGVTLKTTTEHLWELFSVTRRQKVTTAERRESGLFQDQRDDARTDTDRFKSLIYTF